MIGYDCHALQRSSTGILHEGINECIQLFIWGDLNFVNNLPADILQLLFPVTKSIVNISGFYNIWKVWHTWFSIFITRLTVNRVKWSSNTYSRSVDAKFSGQNEKRSSQHVDVHLWMRQPRMSKRCYSADVKYLALPGKVYLLSPGAIKSIQSHLKNYSRVRLSTLSGYEIRPLHHRQDKCSGYIIDLKVAEHHASIGLWFGTVDSSPMKTPAAALAVPACFGFSARSGQSWLFLTLNSPENSGALACCDELIEF